MKPINDNVIVKQDDKETKSSGGIILSDNQADRPVEGVVIAVGNGRTLPTGERSKMTVKAGDKVLFAKHAGSEVKHGDEKYLVMLEDDIKIILEE